jgi:REP element-mobilizing transposase RayT
MARRPRDFRTGHPYHITHKALVGIVLFTTVAERLYYLELLRRQATRLSVEIISWDLMRTHIHLAVIAPDEKAISEMICRVDGTYARRVNRRMKRTGPVFASRFHSSHIPDETYLHAVLRYIPQNPVRANMATEAWDYPWSSALYQVGFASTDHLVQTREPLGLKINWKDLLTSRPAGAAETDEAAEIRSAGRQNRPIGIYGGEYDVTEEPTQPCSWPLRRAR